MINVALLIKIDRFKRGNCDVSGKSRVKGNRGVKYEPVSHTELEERQIEKALDNEKERRGLSDFDRSKRG